MKKSQNDIKLWALIIGIALGIVGIGAIVLIIYGGSFGDMFADFGDMQPILLVVALGVIVASFLILYNFSKRVPYRRTWTVKELVVGALCISLAFILSYVKIFNFPQGGSITPASMLPVMVYSYIYGVRHGLIAGLALGILNLIQDAYVVHWAQMLTDYCFAFMAIGLAGIFKTALLPGIVLASLGRFAFAVLSGVVFFSEYAPPEMSAFWYSFSYNGTYMLPEMAICAGTAFIPAVRNAIDGLRLEHRVPTGEILSEEKSDV